MNIGLDSREGHMSSRILIIDDDADTVDLLDMILKEDGHAVFRAYSGMDGLRKAYDAHPDLIILDIMMPGMDGFEVCDRLRDMTQVPVLMLTAKSGDADVLRGFRMGADDYVHKPFSNAELRARVQALIRRKNSHNHEELPVLASYDDGLLIVDFEEQTVVLNDREIQLSATEFHLLTVLIQHQRNVVPQRELLREVWGDGFENSPAMVSLYIYYLRKKLSNGGHGHQYIHTQWGRGYWFAPRSDSSGLN